LLLGAADAGSAAVTKLLLQRSADIDAVGGRGQTALTIAAWRNHGAVVDALLASGADPNVRAVGGITALMGAAVNATPR
ncbi:MAG: ankyrin repeat domain-containing protein, partial [Alphaproteobacteria bacterium]